MSSSSSSSGSGKQKKVAIIGAGPVGAMAALALSKRGYKVDVFEKRPDSRTNKIYEGRSINLALSQRGRTALRKFGLEDEMVNSGVEMKSRLIHTLSGATYSVPYGPNGEAILSISRQGINELLVNAAEAQENVTFQFNTGCEEVNLLRREIVLSVETPSPSDAADDKKKTPPTFETKIYNDYDFIIGSDGARSAARKAIIDRNGYDYSQKYLDHDYKELTIPANPDGSYKLSPYNALHIWPRGDFMMIGLPNQDGSFTMTLFMPHKNFEAINTDDEITSFFNTNFPDAVPLMPTLLEDYKRNRTSRLCTINLFPWHYSDFLVIMGDAAHAVVPFYGQGMNASLEDVNVFDSLFDQFGDQNVAAVLEHFSTVRPKDADAIGYLSQQNYLEMRSHVTSPLFLIRSQVEKFICRNPFLRNSLCLGYSFLPKYSMVAFSNIPYAEVIRRDKEQTERLDLILYRLFPASVLSISLGLLFVPAVRNQISSLVSKTLSLLSPSKK